MYTEHFGLSEKPFSISPDPRYLYLSQRHADALAHLIYGISESGGFIQLTGEVGTGKTTLIRSLLDQLPENTEVALVLNPPLTTQEFLYSICQELRIPAAADQTPKALIDQLNTYLLAANAEDRRIVLIVDEAQTLSAALLEQVRLLTNLETSKRKLLQIILIGQPELRELLDRPEMRQIAQRITGRYHLEPLSTADTRIYVRHRLRVAGAHNDIFSERAMSELYRLAGGIPRLINVIADRSLLAAYTRDQRRIGVRLVRQAAAEVFGRSRSKRRRAWFAAAATGAGTIAIASGLLMTVLAPKDDTPSTPIAREETDLLPALALEAQAAPADATPVRSDAGPTLPLGDLLATAADQPDDERVTRSLFAMWGADYSPTSGTACEQAAAAGLSCLALPEASLADLRQMNRPVVLTLNDAKSGSGSRSALLRTLGYDSAEITVGDTTARVSIADLAQHWFGEHWLLWQPATEIAADLQPGMRAKRVVWLREALASFRGEPVPTEAADDPELFDEALAEWVRDYQRHRHLWVDGVVGQQTQIALQADLGHPAGPTLRGDE